jgi:hypothetical protein
MSGAWRVLTPHESFVVSGAGDAELNGVYHPDTGAELPRERMCAYRQEGGGVGRVVFHKNSASHGTWAIRKNDYFDSDHAYYNETMSPAPPLEGWEVWFDDVSPPPPPVLAPVAAEAKAEPAEPQTGPGPTGAARGVSVRWLRIELLERLKEMVEYSEHGRVSDDGVLEFEAFDAGSESWTGVYRKMTTADVCFQFVKRQTASRHCRYVELDDMRPNVGKSDAFASHCWGASFIDLVAAIVHALEDDQFVWIECASCSFELINSSATPFITTKSPRPVPQHHLASSLHRCEAALPLACFAACLRCCSTATRRSCASSRRPTSTSRRSCSHVARSSSVRPRSPRSKVS